MFSSMTFADWCGVYIMLAIAWAIWEFIDTTRRLLALVNGTPFTEYVRKGEEEETLRDGKEVKMFIENLRAKTPVGATLFLLIVITSLSATKGAAWIYYLIVMFKSRQVVIHNEK